MAGREPPSRNGVTYRVAWTVRSIATESVSCSDAKMWLAASLFPLLPVFAGNVTRSVVLLGVDLICHGCGAQQLSQAGWKSGIDVVQQFGLARSELGRLSC